MTGLDFIKNTPEQTDKIKSPIKLGRRNFLKMLAVLSADVAISKSVGGKTLTSLTERIENSSMEEVESNFWLSIIESISRQPGEKISPREVRAYIITKLFNIPQGQTSGISTEVGSYPGEQKRLYPELDKLVATYFTNKTVVVVKYKTGEPIISTDFRDFPNIGNALEEFKNEVNQLDIDSGKKLGIKIYKILKEEYDHLREINRENKNKNEKDIDHDDLDRAVEFIYLPGGVPIFLRGYRHNVEWQNKHGKHLASAYSDVDYVGIEGFAQKEIGESLAILWADKEQQGGHYDRLMKDLVAEGFKGLFFEADGRNKSKVIFDSYVDKFENGHQVILPGVFYEHYFMYLQKESPNFAAKMKSPQMLKKFMLAQTTFKPSLIKSNAMVANRGKMYDASFSVSDELTVATLPTGNELGQRAFSDALYALKLHILAQSMNEGEIPKGTIVDFQGANHFAMKSFYLKYPQRAAEVVLTIIYELMAGYVGDDLSKMEYYVGVNKPKNLEKAMEMLKKPDWLQAIYEIGRISMMEVENDSGKTVEVGEKQKKIKKYDWEGVNILKKVDPKIIMALFDDEYIQTQIDKVSSDKESNTSRV